jgi:DNA ligase (NAD+)
LIDYHTRRYFVDDDPEITDAEFDALVAELTASRPPPGGGPSRLADPDSGGWRPAAVHRGQASHADDVAGQDDQLRGAAGLGQADGPVHLGRRGLHLRAQDRRAGHEPALRGWPHLFGPPPGATARSARTSRPTSSPSASHPPRTAGPPPRRRRGARARSTCRSPPSRSSTGGRWPGARVHQPRNAARDRCARRIPAVTASASWGSGPTSWGRSRAARSSPATAETLEWMRSAGFPVNPHIRFCTVSRKSTNTAGDWLRAAPHARLRDRRHGHQGRRPGAAPELGATSKAPRWAIAYKFPPRRRPPC